MNKNIWKNERMKELNELQMMGLAFCLDIIGFCSELECGNMRQIARGKILVYLFCFI
jgi:hypothetical protein